MSALGKGLGSLIPNKKQRPSIMSLDIDESIGDKKIEQVAIGKIISILGNHVLILIKTSSMN